MKQLVAAAEKLEQNGYPPPKELLERPRLKLEELYWATQFLSIHRARAAGFSGPQPISIESITAYMGLFPQWDELLFFETITAIDAEYMNHMAKEAERQAARRKSGN